MTFWAHCFLDCLSRIDGRQKSLDVKSYMFIWKKRVGTAWIGEGKNLGLRQPYSPVCKCVGEKHLNGTRCYPTRRFFSTSDEYIFLKNSEVSSNIYRLNEHI